LAGATRLCRAAALSWNESHRDFRNLDIPFSEHSHIEVKTVYEPFRTSQSLIVHHFLLLYIKKAKSPSNSSLPTLNENR
jgi:hypothetical protein